MLKSFGVAPERIRVVVVRYCSEQLLESDPYRQQLLEGLEGIFLPYFTAE